MFKNEIQMFWMLTVGSDFDVIDEALQFFKANVFFRNYEIKVILVLNRFRTEKMRSFYMC